MLPNLSNEKHIALDIETYDPEIKLSLGHLSGYIVGVAIAVPGRSWYFSLSHPESENLQPSLFYEWMRDQVCSEDKTIYGANLPYDLSFLNQINIDIRGKLFDIQIAEPLIDENAFSYSLDTLAHKYLGTGKVEGKMEAWARENLGKREKLKSNIYRMPAHIVEEYAKADAELPLQIARRQKAIMKRERLTQVFELEQDLMHLMLRMREHGVRIDVDKVDAAASVFFKDEIQFHKQLNEIAGEKINVNAAASIGKMCDDLGLEYPRTEKTGAPSFKKGWLEANIGTHEVFDLILKVRKASKIRATFLEGSIKKYLRDGRIYTRFNQLRSDEFGTVTGRFSSSHPNLQFIPSRDENSKKLLRGLFIPEEEHTWVKADYSSIEPRMALHFSDGMMDVKQWLWNNKDADVYKPMLDALPGFKRSLIKAIYLGISYGMGKQKMADQLQMTKDEVIPFINTFNNAVPYVRKLSNNAGGVAAHLGYITTLMGRRRRFNKYESAGEWGQPALDYDEALRVYGPGNVKRAFTYKAFNAFIQGSSADIMKKAMVDLHKSGIFERIPYPHLTVHDELDFSIPKGQEKEIIPEIQDIMENCVNLTVPMNVDITKGDNWGEC